ncbi:MAG TPA: hypothetical protein VN950_02900 [Terriglobales bacterium]|nr:hypothetical protein [Terriglobales bacterium]
MQKRTTILSGFILLGSCLMVSVAADERPPTFFFGGQQIHIGMSQQEAAAALYHCCKLSPPVESEIEKRPSAEGAMLGHFILSKEESSSQGILGAIYFSGGKVLRVTRPLAEEVDGYNDDVVGFARSIKRSLAGEGDAEMTATISIRHERISNAESDVLLLTLKDGRGIEIHIGTLDKPNDLTNKRDFVTVDETLEPAAQRAQARK